MQLALDRTTGRQVAIKFVERGDKVWGLTGVELGAAAPVEGRAWESRRCLLLSSRCVRLGDWPWHRCLAARRVCIVVCDGRWLLVHWVLAADTSPPRGCR